MENENIFKNYHALFLFAREMNRSFAIACILSSSSSSSSFYSNGHSVAHAWTSLPRILSLAESNLRHFSLVPIPSPHSSSDMELVKFEERHIHNNNVTRTTSLDEYYRGRDTTPINNVGIMTAKSTSGVEKTILAVRDGLAASMASIVSVFLLMWLRTSMVSRSLFRVFFGVLICSQCPT